MIIRDERTEVANALFDWDMGLSPLPVESVRRDALSSLSTLVRPSRTSLVYTAFDGDHFGLLPAVRRYVLRRGKVPANPESIVGYRDSVRARGSKRGVMLDDLAIVGRCDELWIFSNATPTPIGLATQLAEGALIELLYFLRQKEKLHEAPQVHVVPLNGLGPCSAERETRFKAGYLETAQALSSRQVGILDLLEGIEASELAIPMVHAYLHDPLDTKYVHWLRADGYRTGVVPLVLQLAVEAGETLGLEPASRSGKVRPALLCWVELLRIADELVVMPPVAIGQRESLCVEAVLASWEPSRPTPIKGVWRDFGTPKSVSRESWSITSKERDSLC